MISSSQTSFGLLLACSCALISLVVCLMSTRALLFRQVIESPAFHRNQQYLDVLLVSLTILSLIAWPQFYLTLRSYVPELAVQGVMCVYGVTQLSPVIGWIQWGFPLVLWLLGLSWWLGSGYRMPGAVSLYYVRMAVGWLAGVVAMATYSVVVVYLAGPKSDRLVTCCTQFVAVDSIMAPQTSAVAALRAACAPGFDRYSMLAFCGLNLAFGIWLYSRSRVYRNWLPTGKELLLTSVAAVSNLVLNAYIWPESIAPYILKLPYHHCAYELLTDTWALGLAAACALVGNFGLFWPAVLFLLPATDSIKRLLLNQSTEFCSIAILSEVIILAIQAA